jgi:hypothetical protein
LVFPNPGGRGRREEDQEWSKVGKGGRALIAKPCRSKKLFDTPNNGSRFRVFDREEDFD